MFAMLSMRPHQFSIPARGALKHLVPALTIVSAVSGYAQGRTDLGLQASLIGSFPQSDLKDQTSTSGFGLSISWSFWQMSPNCQLGAYVEHRTYSTHAERANLSDAGLNLLTTIRGGFYNRIAIGAERVDLPGATATTKLGGEFGFGYRFKSSLGVEVYESRLAASSPSSTALNLAVSWYF
jgi:hypothetical protein